MLPEVVINDQGMAATIPELFTHRAACIGSHILHGCRVAGPRCDHYCILHGSILLEGVANGCHGGLLLPDGDVDTEDIASLLVEDCIHSNGCFSGLTVTDDQLPLTSSNGDHGVNAFQSCLEGFLHRLSFHYIRRHTFDQPQLIGMDGTFSINGLAHGIDNSS